MLDLGPKPRRRRASLTPMIDVVFLLLIFFMLAARFGMPVAEPLRLAAPGADVAWQGPPRLVTITPHAVLLNGQPSADLLTDLSALMTSDQDTVILTAREGADVQRLLDVMARLKDAGIAQLAVVE
jgi:biopolymer transport protein ExbD